MRRLSGLAILLVCLIGIYAYAADNNFPTPGGATVDGKLDMQLDPSGSAVPVGPNTPGIVSGNTNIATYSTAVIGLSNSSAGDVFCINGSATKVVKVKGIRVNATGGTAAVADVSVVLRSSLDTGGGLASVTMVKNDPLNAPATATVNSFTSNPTPGTLVGAVRSMKMAVGTQGNTATSSEGLFQFTVYWDQPMTLRAATSQLCVATTAISTGSWDIDAEMTEE